MCVRTRTHVCEFVFIDKIYKYSTLYSTDNSGSVGRTARDPVAYATNYPVFAAAPANTLFIDKLCVCVCVSVC